MRRSEWLWESREAADAHLMHADHGYLIRPPVVNKTMMTIKRINSVYSCLQGKY